MDRTTVQALVDHIYSVRKMNNAALAAGLFCHDAVFEMAGSPGPGRIAARVEHAESIGALMKSFVDAWEWLDHEILDVVIDGSRAAVRYRTRQRFIPTNQIVETDLFDLVTFRDGKIAHMVEFCDTALATDLIQIAMNQAAKSS